MTEMQQGLVVQHGAARNLVLADGDDPAEEGLLYTCGVRGRLRKGPRERVRTVVIGDRIEFTVVDPATREGVIEQVLPRENQISRPQPSGGSHRKLEQVVVANLHRVWVVASLVDPPLNLRFVDRILAASALQGVDAGVVLNKADLASGADPTPILSVYRALGLPVHLCSAETGVGLDGVARDLRGHLQAFVGLSGVGKSSLLAAIQPGLELRVQSVGERHGHGRHTTTASRLFWLPKVEGWVADTPGMREFGMWGLIKPQLSAGFVEIEEAAAGCRFRDCVHVSEPGCAVRAGVEDGTIAEARYESYRGLLGELPQDELERDRGI